MNNRKIFRAPRLWANPARGKAKRQINLIYYSSSLFIYLFFFLSSRLLKIPASRHFSRNYTYTYYIITIRNIKLRAADKRVETNMQACTPNRKEKKMTDAWLGWPHKLNAVGRQTYISVRWCELYSAVISNSAFQYTPIVCVCAWVQWTTTPGRYAIIAAISPYQNHHTTPHTNQQKLSSRFWSNNNYSSYTKIYNTPKAI